jgi:hypothetical protein
MREATLTGGCQCGAVRYAIHETPYQIGICHCRMCQKAYGAPFAASFTVKKANLEWTRGKPATFKSSLHIERGFCRDCGTPLYTSYDSSDVTHPSVGSLDDPSAVTPEYQVGVESRVAWFGGLLSLPAMTTADAFKGYEAIAEEIRATNRQHPDHDTKVWPPEAGGSR